MPIYCTSKLTFVNVIPNTFFNVVDDKISLRSLLLFQTGIAGNGNIIYRVIAHVYNTIHPSFRGTGDVISMVLKIFSTALASNDNNTA